jgi:hypothetical protein
VGFLEVPALRVYQAWLEDIFGLQAVSDDQLIPNM